MLLLALATLLIAFAIGGSVALVRAAWGSVRDELKEDDTDATW